MWVTWPTLLFISYYLTSSLQSVVQLRLLNRWQYWQCEFRWQCVRKELKRVFRRFFIRWWNSSKKCSTRAWWATYNYTPSEKHHIIKDSNPTWKLGICIINLNNMCVDCWDIINRINVLAVVLIVRVETTSFLLT